MHILKLQDSLLPLLILAYVTPAVTFLNPLFNAATRWAVLVLVLAYLVLNVHLWRAFSRTQFVLLTLIFVLWAATTTIWSEVPLLSGLKVVALIAIVFTSMAAGQMWTRQHQHQDTLNFLLPLTIVTLLAGVLGRYSAEAIVESGPTIMYQGLVANPNMFGSMLAMCSPFLLWQIHSHWRSPRQRAIWLVLGALGLYYLFAARSRGAMIVVMCGLLGLFFSLRMSRKLQLTIVLVGLGMGGVLFATGMLRQFQEIIIFKNSGIEEQGILFTRALVWEESYELAKKGGWIGGGYGVTIGDGNFDGGLTAVGYGREKGNSQMAIIEETGLIGLMIYLSSLIVLFVHLGRKALEWPEGPMRTMLGIVTGVLFGMVMHSVFEAWWVAPASAESVYFWTMAGVALGLARLKPVPAKHAPQGEKPQGRHISQPCHDRRSISR